MSWNFLFFVGYGVPKGPYTHVPSKKTGCHFSDFPNILEGRLPPEDGSDQAENLTRSVSDDIAKNIFLGRSKNPGVTFWLFPIFWKYVRVRANVHANIFFAISSETDRVKFSA